MAIDVRCKCGGKFKAKESMIGKRAKCPKCGAVLRISAPTNSAGSEPSTGKQAKTAKKPTPAEPQAPVAAVEPSPTASDDLFADLGDLNASANDPLGMGGGGGAVPQQPAMPMQSTPPGYAPQHPAQTHGAAPPKASGKASSLRLALILGGGAGALLLVVAIAAIAVWALSAGSEPSTDSIASSGVGGTGFDGTEDDRNGIDRTETDGAESGSTPAAASGLPSRRGSSPQTANKLQPEGDPPRVEYISAKELNIPYVEFLKLTEQPVTVEGESFTEQYNNPANFRRLELTVIKSEESTTGGVKVETKGALHRDLYHCTRLKQMVEFADENMPDPPLEYGDRIVADLLITGEGLGSTTFATNGAATRVVSREPLDEQRKSAVKKSKAAFDRLVELGVIPRIPTQPQAGRVFTGDVQINVIPSSTWLAGQSQWPPEVLSALSDLQATDALALSIRLKAYGKDEQPLDAGIVSALPANLPVTDLRLAITESDSPVELLQAVSRWKTLRTLAFGRVYPPAPVVEDELAPISSLPELITLKLHFNEYDNGCLPHIAKLTKLKFLDLSGNKVSGDALQQLTALQQLEVLNLGNTSVGDEDLRVLASLPNLKVLNLKGTEITDAALVHLADCNSLTQLDLTATNITGAGLDSLESISTLEGLYLGGTSAKGDQRLTKAMPNLKIYSTTAGMPELTGNGYRCKF
jgi:hypothetical protein